MRTSDASDGMGKNRTSKKKQTETRGKKGTRRTQHGNEAETSATLLFPTEMTMAREYNAAPLLATSTRKR